MGIVRSRQSAAMFAKSVQLRAQAQEDEIAGLEKSARQEDYLPSQF
jgi:hypothetical protein